MNVQTALSEFQQVDRVYKPSASWWAEQLGCSTRTIYRWRNGTRNPKIYKRSLHGVCLDLKNGNLKHRNRLCYKHNMEARIKSSGKPCTGFTGVTLHKQSNLYKISLEKSGRIYYFPDPNRAALHYNRVCGVEYGDCAFLNELPDLPKYRCSVCGVEDELVCEYEVLRRTKKKGCGEESGFSFSKKGSRLFCLSCRPPAIDSKHNYRMVR